MPPEAYLATLARIARRLLDGKEMPETIEIKPAKLAVSAETERLKAILIQVIKILMKYEPDTAQGFMDQVMPPELPIAS